MNATTRGTSPFLTPPAWTQALERHGFVATGNAYQLDAIIATATADWLVLRTPPSTNPPGRSQPATHPTGLWKWVEDGQHQHFVFELPASVVSSGSDELDSDNSGPGLAESLLDWALATAQGAIPEGWHPPAQELVDSWLPKSALSVRVGPLVRQGELLLAPERWALRFPILPCEPARLPHQRRRALALLAADAQNQRRMVRVSLSDDAESAGLIASVYLTGAPHSELLFLAGLDGLTQIVAWLAESADLLGDVSLTFRALGVTRRQTQRAERKHHDSYH